MLLWLLYGAEPVTGMLFHTVKVTRVKSNCMVRDSDERIKALRVSVKRDNSGGDVKR